MAIHENLNKKINLILLLILIISTTIGIVAYSTVTNEQIKQDLENKATETTKRISANLAEPLWEIDLNNINIIITFEIQDPAIISITIKDPDNNVIKKITNKQNTIETGVIQTDILKKNDIIKNNRKIGTVEIAFTEKLAKDEMKKTIRTTIEIMIFFTSFIFLVLLMMINSFIIQPVKELNQAVELAKKGNFKIRVKTRSKDEIGKLAESFNQLSEQLIKKQEELDKHQKHLEKEVEKRTEDLQKANEELKQFNRLAVGRELKMVELKKKISDLEKKR